MIKDIIAWLVIIYTGASVFLGSWHFIDGCVKGGKTTDTYLNRIFFTTFLASKTGKFLCQEIVEDKKCLKPVPAHIQFCADYNYVVCMNRDLCMEYCAPKFSGCLKGDDRIK